MKIYTKTFNELSIEELYQILQLRSEVFVVEQDCVYQDVDGKDQKALHVFGEKDGRIVAYTRCFAPGLYFSEAAIGRVVVKESQRKFGLGHEIMKESVRAISEYYQTETIALSAQTYLVKFYQEHSFEPVGDEYLEDGIPHIKMIRSSI
ncbi:MAG: GNAT family N-acetyltransferase [Flavobacteriaceae bacterium]|nr:GNAT family N-acetyltransferase [Flavobacteriaceae bacterium]